MNTHQVTLEGLDLGLARRAIEHEIAAIHDAEPSDDYTAAEIAEDEQELLELAGVIGRYGDPRTSVTAPYGETRRLLRCALRGLQMHFDTAGYDETSEDPADWANLYDGIAAHNLERRLTDPV